MTPDYRTTNHQTPANLNRCTFILLYAACFIEGADLQLLPSSFKALEQDIGLTPTSLAGMSLCQALFQSVTAPLWGIMIDHGTSAKQVLVTGVASWGLLTMMLGFVTQIRTMYILRILNGLALATITPVSQTMIAERTMQAERGRAFGRVDSARAFGTVLCSLLTTRISEQVLFGFAGWRIAFMMVAIMSIFLSIVLSVDLPEHSRERKDVDVFTELRAFWRYLTIPSFAIITVQGCFGSVPWSALAFFTMFLQYSGYSDGASGTLNALMLFSQACGCALGGHIGDELTRLSRFHGRPLTAQISVMSGIPLIFAVLTLVPSGELGFILLAMLLMTFGLTASWCSGGVNRPVLTDVVEAHHHARIISWLSAMEGSSAACLGAPLVGYLAVHAFGYQPYEGPVSELSSDLRLRNADALAVGMLWMTILPWCLCFLTYSLLHLTYGHDVESLSDDRAESTPLADASLKL